MAFRLCVALGFLAVAIVFALALRGFLADLLSLVRRSSPWQRGLLAVLSVAFVLYGGDKNDATNPPPAQPPLRMNTYPGAVTTETGWYPWQIPDSLPQFALPDGYVATNLEFFAFRGGTNVAFGLTWPTDDPDESYNLDLYCNWELGGGPWVLVDSLEVQRGSVFLVGELRWPELVADAIAAGDFPTNASCQSCFLTAAWAADTDEDGLGDGDEIYIYRTDPNDPDTDGDDCIDWDEIYLGTDPRNPDTDGDGLFDGWEWNYEGYGFSPFVWDDADLDVDEDGLTNREESQYGTDPWHEDTDGDGFSDELEVRLGMDPLSAGGEEGAAGDFDRDGLTNTVELDIGLDPFDPDTDGDGLIDSKDPRPLTSDGNCLGQSDEWVEANFTNATQILSAGYTNWVNASVGWGEANGLYRLSSSICGTEGRRVRVTVGPYDVFVTNDCTFVFLLEKGVRYDLSVDPSDVQADFAADSDAPRLGLSSTASPTTDSARWEDCRWSEDGGRLILHFPQPDHPGYVLWLPMLSVAPVNWDPSAGDSTENFTAVFHDVTRWFSPQSYSWTGGGEVVDIASPGAKSTLMTCLHPNVGVPPLMLTVDVGGERLYSHFRGSREERERATLSVSLPDVMFTDDDDDDDDGQEDYGSQNLMNDDVGCGAITLKSDMWTNGVVRVERLSCPGCDVYCNDAQTDALWEGRSWQVDGMGWSVPLYVVPFSATGYRAGEIKVRWIPSVGSEQVVVRRFTVVRPTVEPICVETKRVGTRVSTFNPAGVAVGGDAYFQISVNPAGFPDDRIVWSARGEGRLMFVGGNRGRTVRVRGVSVGEVTLRAGLRSSGTDAPEFTVYVTQPQSVPIHAMIVEGQDGPAKTIDEVQSMIADVNEIYSQIGMSFYLATCATTNINDAANITEEQVPGMSNWWHGRLTDLMTGTGGVECYFVDDIVNAMGGPTRINGLTSAKGIVICKNASFKTLAHELGHACGAEDIYLEDETGGLSLDGEYISAERSRFDWNGGCDGHGAAGARFYPHAQDLASIVRRLLMYGDNEGDDDIRRDMTLGGVFGVHYEYNSQGVKVYEKSNAAVGFKDFSGFRRPISE